MDLGRYLVEAHLREGRPVAELAGAHGVHRSWIYKLLARYRDEGDAGLAPRSRRPRSSPTQVAAELEEEVVTLRKQLSEEGLDAGGDAPCNWSRRVGACRYSASSKTRERTGRRPGEHYCMEEQARLGRRDREQGRRLRGSR
jgi:transposase-like protein